MMFKSLQMVFQKDYLTYTSPSFNDCSTTGSSVHLTSVSAILIGILVLVIVAPLQAQPLIPGGNNQNFEYKRYCSNSLPDVIRLLCGGRTSSQQTAQYPNANGTFSSYNLNRLANDDDIHYKNLQTDRIHECCLRPCGYSELKMYCAPV